MSRIHHPVILLGMALLAAVLAQAGSQASDRTTVRLERRRMELQKPGAAELEADRAKRTDELLRSKALMERGAAKVYRGEQLTAISLPVGGIAAGCVQINGQAKRTVWQIFNNSQQSFLPDSFFAVRVKADSAEPVVRALQTEAVGPFAPMKELTFRGEYPFGWYDFEDPDLPVKLSLETFSPLIPLDTKDSAIPCAVYNITAENQSGKTVEVSLLATQQNAVGFTGEAEINGRTYPGYGGNTNELVRRDGATILHMTSEAAKDSPGWGDMALTALAGTASATADWAELPDVHGDFAADGALTGPETAGPSSAGQTIDGALAVPFDLKPGQKRTVTFVLTWNFPNAKQGDGQWGGKGNMYANWWPSALDTALDLGARLPELTRKTRLYHDTFYQGNLPHWLLDRITSQVAILSSRTTFWTKDGYFGGWEGCNSGSGCCAGNCSHVWHYAQAHARLFPEIGRRMRDQELDHQAPDGGVPHRQAPGHGPAFDGQCGTILGAYREHLLSTDRKWLDAEWPKVKKAMGYLIATSDKDEDGILSGPQWNTLDANLSGSTSWMGTLYLASLAACEKMALLEGDPESAKHYRRIRESGSKKQDETLWNGEYYIQIPDAELQRDYLQGCQIDQLLGQWWAAQLDLGWLYPPDHVRAALASLFNCNFHGNFVGLTQSPRKFVDDNDSALQMITWPKGGRPDPEHEMMYATEVMTGFEYAAAATMVQADLLKLGFAIVRAAYDRYDGRLRTSLSGGDNASWGYSGNPFGDDECGKFYARAMSVWSMLLACQGFTCDGPAGVIGFRPKWKPEDHKSFFTASEGWGLFIQTRVAGKQTDRIELRSGRLDLSKMIFELPDGMNLPDVTVKIAGKKVQAAHSVEDGVLTVSFPSKVTVGEGQAAVVVAE